MVVAGLYTLIVLTLSASIYVMGPSIIRGDGT